MFEHSLFIRNLEYFFNFEEAVSLNINGSAFYISFMVVVWVYFLDLTLFIEVEVLYG